jgi:CBS domain-containing protein
MQRVCDRMSRSLVGIPSAATVAEARRMFQESGADELLVVDGDDLEGLVSLEQLRRRESEELIGDCVSGPPRTIGAHASLDEARALMQHLRCDCLPVTAGGLLLGVLYRTDLGLEEDVIESELGAEPSRSPEDRG